MQAFLLVRDRSAPITDFKGLEVIMVFEQYVLRFQIPVNDAHLVAVVNGIQHALGYGGGLAFIEVFTLDEDVEELAAADDLLHNAVFVGLFVEFE